MWTRARLAISRLLWSVLWSVGTPAVSVPLAVLAVAFMGADAAWRRMGAAPSTLASTWGWWGFAWIAVADAGAAVLRGLPLTLGAEGRFERRSIDRGSIGSVAMRVGWLFVALGLVASSAGTEPLRFRVAQGERFTASPDQLVAREGLRPMRPGPVPLDLLIERVDGGASAGRTSLRARAAEATGGRQITLSRWPTWLAWGRWLRVVDSGVAVRADLTTERGASLDSVVAKLTPGARRADAIRFEGAPLRAVVSPGDGEAFSDGRPPSLRVMAFRGKLAIAEGAVARGEPIVVEGVRLSFPEWLPWVDLELSHDPGLPLVLIGAVLGVVGGGSVALGRRLRRP
ncbi:hypothetical protein [Anaeromyxobacter oryzisoli]|uniref:hypothetical protein n=1 Tax=Anaeromyxobacter oryzisoli TaxID=2925408 RepID=UPI001F5653BA|nr:hypothetical protein [Anaeromyxobacter sp. SG63]